MADIITPLETEIIGLLADLKKSNGSYLKSVESIVIGSGGEIIHKETFVPPCVGIEVVSGTISTTRNDSPTSQWELPITVAIVTYLSDVGASGEAGTPSGAKGCREIMFDVLKRLHHQEFNFGGRVTGPLEFAGMTKTARESMMTYSLQFMLPVADPRTGLYE